MDNTRLTITCEENREGGQEMNHKIKDIHSREELEDFIHKTVGKEAIPELVEEILSLPSGEIISFVCRQYDPVLGHRQQSIRVFHNSDN